MKKISALLLIALMALTLIACGTGSYDPVPATDEESTKALTLTLDGKTYEVTYDLYRAMFLNYKDTVDGGNDEVWSSEGKDAYIEEINDLITDNISYIYAAFAVCENIGFDPFGEEANNEIQEYIKTAVDSEPYNGDYDAYLSSLKENGFNYEAHTLILRWGIATEAINNYYIGTLDEEDIQNGIYVGSIEYTEEDIRDYYYSDNCALVLRGYINGAEHDAAWATEAHNEINSVLTDGESEIRRTMAQYCSTTPGELQNGTLIGKHTLNPMRYSELTDAAFALKEGRLSSVIHIGAEGGGEYFILYRLYKNEAHFDANYTDVVAAFLNDSVGGIISSAKQALKDSATVTDFINELNYADISID